MSFGERRASHIGGHLLGEFTDRGRPAQRHDDAPPVSEIVEVRA
jgi:hypothetical protein